VPKPLVADRQGVAPQLREHGPDDARAGKDHLRALGLQPAGTVGFSSTLSASLASSRNSACWSSVSLGEVVVDT
jgi:hypothetical protein